MTPDMAGLKPAKLDDIRGGDPAENAATLHALLAGAEAPFRDIVLLNAAAALIVAGKAKDLKEGVRHRREIDRLGAAKRCSKRSSRLPMRRMPPHERCPCPHLRWQAQRSRARAYRRVRWTRSSALRARHRRRVALSPRSSAARRRALWPDRRDQESLAQRRADPARFRSRRPRPRLCARRRDLPFGADRRSLFPGRDRALWRRARPARCRCCARISWSIPTRSSKPARIGADCILLIMAALTTEPAHSNGSASELGYGRSGRGAYAESWSARWS